MYFLLCPLLFLFSFLCAEEKLTEGIFYRHVEAPNSTYLDYWTGPQSIHILEVDPNLCAIKPVKSVDSGIGRETVLSIAKRKKAIGAVNASFFKIGGLLDGRSAGTLKIDSWYSLPVKPRGCIGWNFQGSMFYFDRLLVSLECKYEGTSFLLNGLNRERNLGEAILFNPVFHPTTLTYSDGEEIVIREGIITEVRQEEGSSRIPEEGFILSLQKNHPLFGTFTVGSAISFHFNLEPQEGFFAAQDWDPCDYIVGGTPLLIYNNQKVLDFSSERAILTFIINRHARTAMGVLQNGHVIFVVVDKTSIFNGMTLYELTDFMHSLGCVYALNLDGGGSSTLVYQGEVKNSPRGDEDEVLEKTKLRRVSDSIIIIPK